MAVIAISQQIGSRGSELGQLAADALGYRFRTGEQIIAETATRYNVSAEQMLVFDMRLPHFWERLKSESPRYIAYYRAILLREASLDKLVVAGRSSAHFMPPRGTGIRVRTVAPFDVRVKQVANEEKLAAAAADRRVREYDTEVKARSQSLFGIDLDDPGVYDLVINTVHIPLPTLAATLTSMANRIDEDAASAPARGRAMLDAAIAAEVHAALIAHPKIRDAQVAVACASGVVRVSGPGLVPPWDDLVIGVAKTVDGVASVEVGAEEDPITLTTS